MSREEQVRQAEANLALLRGSVIGALAAADLSADGAMVPTTVEPESDGDNWTGAAIITRSGVRYRVSVDYA